MNGSVVRIVGRCSEGFVASVADAFEGDEDNATVEDLEHIENKHRRGLQRAHDKGCNCGGEVTLRVSFQ